MTRELTAEQQAESELLSEILRTLKDGQDDERRKAIETLVPKLANKQTARDEFIRLLDFGREKSKTKEPNDPWAYYKGQVRSWSAGALERLCGSTDKKARDAVIRSLDRETEQIPRRWMLSYLCKMGDREEIEATVRQEAAEFKDGDKEIKGHRSGLLALVILSSWDDREASEKLESLVQSGDETLQWEICQCARLSGGCRPILEPLFHISQDENKWDGTRLKAVEAIRCVESPAALRLLGKVLDSGSSPMLKEAAIVGLQQLSGSRRLSAVIDELEKVGDTQYSVPDCLMRALLDENAQIRHRAAQSLPQVLLDHSSYKEGDEEGLGRAQEQARITAAQTVVDQLVREAASPENNVPLLVDALRLIDPPEGEAAAAVLRQYLFSEDISERQRAEQALKLMGGEKALQTLMNQRSEVLRTYNELLAQADRPIQALFEETMRQAQSSFRISQWMTMIVFGIGAGALVAGLSLAFIAGESGVQRVFGAGTSVVGMLAIIVDLLIRDPHKRVQESTSVLLRIKVIFLGYLRQVHQIDATFKHEFIESGKEFGLDDARETSKQIEEVMKNTMAMIDTHLPVRKNENLAVDEVLGAWQDKMKAATAGTGEPETKAK